MNEDEFSPGRALAWAVFLGMSWTWCIGMFLPVLFLRDLGIGGFWVFVIPNVLGATAMGWVLRDPDQSRRLVQQHATACAVFSIITIIFHAFFAGWIIRLLTGLAGGPALGLAFFIFWIILSFRGGNFLAAGLALGISLSVMIWAFWRHELPNVAHPLPGSPTTLPPIATLWLAVACVFGFSLCPYLDLTFHAARQNLQRVESRAAFSIGFGVLFLIMVLFTAAYSGPLRNFLDANAGLSHRLIFILSAHLIVQSCFTVAVHVQALAQRRRQISTGRFLMFVAVLIFAITLGFRDPGGLLPRLGMSLDEVYYRCFLGFYALAFPAYVWLRMIPPARTNYHLAVAIAAAAPMFAAAFVFQKMVWIVPGVLVVLAAKVKVRRRD